MKQQRQQIEDAICSLTELLRNEDVTEAQCQEFFEHHSVVWNVLGFDRAVSHPSLPNEEGGFDYPDFVANHRLGRWEVIEIKTPDLPVTKAPGKRRSNLRAETHDFLAQVVGYAERFADSKVRDHFENAHDISIPPFPRVRLIAGGGKHFERVRIEKEIQRMSHPIEVLSYADILNELHANRANLIGQD
jgi:hypothetical protein